MFHYSWGTESSSTDTQTTSYPPGLVPVVAPQIANGSTVLTVGAGGEFSTLAAACEAAQNGDTILVAAGTYTNDFATVTTSITIEGVGGMANFVATEPPSNLKGILTVDNNVTVENLSFSGAAISEADGGNGAGIRYEGGQMVLENDSFSNNQDGIMGAPVIPTLTDNTIDIDHCLFQDNGAGDGYTHNAYIGNVSELTFTNNVSEGAIAGHELKSRAYVNNIENNVFQDGATGTASYEIDLPDGGVDTVENNVIEKGPLAENQAMVHFGGEGIPYAGSSLLIEGNQFINDYGPSAVGVLNQTPYSVTITGNQFDNIPASNLASGPAVETNNVNGQGDPLPNQTQIGVLPGNTVIYTDSLAHTLSLTGTILAVEGGGGMLTVTAIAGHVIAMGGSGGMTYNEVGSSGGNTVTTMAGSTNSLSLIGQDLVESAGTDTITCGPCNVTGQVTGTAVISDGTGNNQWSVLGTATITGQGGNPVVSVGSSGNATILGSVGYLSVTNNGGDFNFSVGQGGSQESMSDTGGAVDVQVFDAGMQIATAAGPVGADLTLGSGTAQVTSVGNDTIYAGSGSDTLILEGQSTVYAGTGTLAIYGRSDVGGASIYGNGGTYLIAGDGGNLTYYGGNKASTVQAQLANITLVGGAGLMTVNGGSDEVMNGGSGGLDYTASDGGGADLITTAAGATDTLTLAAADTVNSYGNDVINDGAGNQTLNVYGNSTINGGAGNSQMVLGGIDTLYGVGSDNVKLLQGAQASIYAGQNTVVTDQDAALVHFTVTGHGSANVTIAGGGAVITGGKDDPGALSVWTTAGTATSVNLGKGTDTVVSNGADLIRAGSGTDSVYLNAAKATVIGSAGTLNVTNQDSSLKDTQTVKGGSGAITYLQGAGSLSFIGGSGSAVIDGGSGVLLVKGGSGSISVKGGEAGFQFTAGSGFANLMLPNDGGTVEFGAGNTDVQVANWGAGDVFNFVAGHGGGVDTITGFREGTDSLNFQGVNVTSENVSGGSTTLMLSDSTKVVLSGFVDTQHIY